jgi:hypothetical protein
MSLNFVILISRKSMMVVFATLILGLVPNAAGALPGVIAPLSNRYSPTGIDECLSPNVYQREAQTDCIPLAFRIECSSDNISFGNPVVCKLKSDAHEDAPIVVKWTLSRGAHQKEQTSKSIKNQLTSSGKTQIIVTFRDVSPKVCFDKASAVLRVIKTHRREVNEFRTET